MLNSASSLFSTCLLGSLILRLPHHRRRRHHHHHNTVPTSLPIHLQMPLGKLNYVSSNGPHRMWLQGTRPDCRLDWDVHVNRINAKASMRLFFLTQLKRNGLSPIDLVKVYLSVIRQVTECVGQIVTTSPLQTTKEPFEAIHKRTPRISPSVTYLEALDNHHQLPTVAGRGEVRWRNVIILTGSTTSCPHQMFGQPERLKGVPLPETHTKRFENVLCTGADLHSERRGRIATILRQYFCGDHGVRGVGLIKDFPQSPWADPMPVIVYWLPYTGTEKILSDATRTVQCTLSLHSSLHRYHRFPL